MFDKLKVCAALLLCAVCNSSVVAQDFPKRQPIKFVVPANAGGGTDLLARITADFLSRKIGQTVVVENKPGASGAIAAAYVDKAPADGYTLYFTSSEIAVLPAVRQNLPYKFDEFTYLVRAFSVQPMLIGSPKLPFSSVNDLVDHMKKNPEKISYGSTGLGAIVHFGMALFEGGAGVKGLHVPYTGIAPVYQEMLAGRIDITETTPPFAEDFKPLASAGTRRNPAYPNVPTLEESGIKNASWDIWYGVIAPRNLPKPIADRLAGELVELYRNPEAIAKFLNAAKFAPETAPLTGEAFRQQTLEEHRNWKAVAQREKVMIQ